MMGVEIRDNGGRLHRVTQAIAGSLSCFLSELEPLEVPRGEGQDLPCSTWLALVAVWRTDGRGRCLVGVCCSGPVVVPWMRMGSGGINAV